MSLKEIFCQERAISILERAFAADKSAHAYIFAGPEGVGRFKTAYEWAKMLLCKEPVKENEFVDSCGLCDCCRLFEADSHPDFHHVYKELLEFTKDGKGKGPPVGLPIDVIREFLVEKAPNRPSLSQRKVFVVSEAEKLNVHSQNALLKVLEEPPEYCSIILLCTRLEKLLPTTQSRCQVIRFGPVVEDRIVQKLKQMGIREDQGRYWARLSQGSLGQACGWGRLELADGNLYETKKRVLNSLSTYDYDEALSLAEWLLGQAKKIAAVWTELDKSTSKADVGRRAQKILILIVISAVYDAMKMNLGDTRVIINCDQKEQIRDLAARFNAEKSAEKIADCHRALRQIDSGVNEKLVFDRLLLSLTVFDIMQTYGK
jgi:DNA polymerase-3 subunit delta'